MILVTEGIYIKSHFIIYNIAKYTQSICYK